jgi:hypothetical protein
MLNEMVGHPIRWQEIFKFFHRPALIGASLQACYAISMLRSSFRISLGFLTSAN